MRYPPRSVSPTSLGWVRKPDLDRDGGRAWEKPDGAYHMFPPGSQDLVVVVNRGREALEQYLKNSKRPGDQERWHKMVLELRKCVDKYKRDNGL